MMQLKTGKKLCPAGEMGINQGNHIEYTGGLTVDSLI
jgi:hypothetical protein